MEGAGRGFCQSRFAVAWKRLTITVIQQASTLGDKLVMSERSKGLSSPRIAAMVLLAGLALSACRPEEQGRIVDFDPGVYKGEADSALEAEDHDALRDRARLQSTI